MFFKCFTIRPYFIASFAIYSGSLGAQTALPYPDKHQRLESIEHEQLGFFVEDHRILIQPKKRFFIVEVPFDESSKTSPFGKFLDSKRHTFKPQFAQGKDWRFIIKISNKLMLIDSYNLNLIFLDPEKPSSIVNESSIAWDSLRPPADAGGEASKVETTNLRQSFKKAFAQHKGERISGISKLPPNWVKDTGENYLLLSRIENHPLLIMNCLDSEIPQCRISRTCHVPKDVFKNRNPQGLIAAREKKQVIFADAKNNNLLSLNFLSCYSVGSIQTFATLPPHLKAVKDLQLDEKNRLWTLTAAPDNFDNASVYYWNLKELKLL
ncbi:MAG: hypothetical protein KBD78_01990 [Oligoflexales bacterium]|nr:hypothetical protein [Oligoflexales bacterium]